MSKALIRQYYDSFNAKNWDQFISLLDDYVIHEVNQGEKEVGKNLFKKFIDRMNISYDEKIEDVIIFESDLANLFAVQYIVHGKYLKTDPGLPEACGQVYQVKGAAFFEIEEGKIKAITNYYNLTEWIDQVKYLARK